MTESPERHENKAAYVEKLETFVFRDGRWDIALCNEGFNDGQKHFLVKIPVPPELINGTVVAEIVPAAQMR
jgi:hypothetical protein